MKAVFRTPLTPAEIRFIVSPAPPERMDCALLRYAAPGRASAVRRAGQAQSAQRRQRVVVGMSSSRASSMASPQVSHAP